LKSSGVALVVAVVVVSAVGLGLWNIGTVQAGTEKVSTPSWTATYTNNYMMADKAPAAKTPTSHPAAANDREDSVKLLRTWTYTDFPPTRGG